VCDKAQIKQTENKSQIKTIKSEHWNEWKKGILKQEMQAINS